MRLCQRCVDAVSLAVSWTKWLIPTVDNPDAHYGRDFPDLVPEPNCEFWAHAKLTQVLSVVLDLSREHRDHMARVAEALK